MTDLKKILEYHADWLKNGGGGRADLSGTDLSLADLSEADLSLADLRGADLRGADLSGADLSRAVGLLSASSWVKANFDFTVEGVVVFKRIGETQYKQPESWDIAEGAIITEVCNPCRTDNCACGVNFGTREWCDNNYQNADLWECLIRWVDLAGVVVPYNTGGKARCEQLQLVRKLEAGHD